MNSDVVQKQVEMFKVRQLTDFSDSVTDYVPS